MSKNNGVAFRLCSLLASHGLLLLDFVTSSSFFLLLLVAADYNAKTRSSVCSSGVRVFLRSTYRYTLDMLVQLGHSLYFFLAFGDCHSHVHTLRLLIGTIHVENGIRLGKL